MAIAIYYRDHAPPHFHALYGDFEITVTIRDGAMQGAFPSRAQGLVSWGVMRRKE